MVGSNEAEYDEYMDYMRTWSKMYLQRVRKVVHTVAMIRSEIDGLAKLMDGIGAVRYDAVRSRSTPDDEGMLRRVERMETLKARYQEELDLNLQWQADAHAALANVRQPWRAVLTYRYLEDMSWSDVAKAAGFSKAYCKTDLHENGLLELYPHIPHEYDDLPDAI